MFLYMKLLNISIFVDVIGMMAAWTDNDQTNRTQHNLHNHMHAAIIPITSTNIEIFNKFIYRNIYSLMMIQKD